MNSIVSFSRHVFKRLLLQSHENFGFYAQELTSFQIQWYYSSQCTYPCVPGVSGSAANTVPHCHKAFSEAILNPLPHSPEI